MTEIKHTLRMIMACLVLTYCAGLALDAMVAFGDFCYAFVSGFVIEFVAVFWVHFSARGKRWRAGGMSAIQAIALVYGITLSGQSHVICGLFVVGYALGSVAAVSLKGRQK